MSVEVISSLMMVHHYYIARRFELSVKLTVLKFPSTKKTTNNASILINHNNTFCPEVISKISGALTV